MVVGREGEVWGSKASMADTMESAASVGDILAVVLCKGKGGWVGGSFSDRVDVSRGSWMARSVGLIGRHGKAALRRLLRLSMLVVCGGL